MTQKKIGFDNEYIYDELKKPLEDRKVKLTRLDGRNSIDSFNIWTSQKDKIFY